MRTTKPTMREQIKACIIDSEGKPNPLSAKAIAQQTGLGLATVRQAISNMVSAHIIHSGGTSRERVYYPGSAARAAASEQKAKAKAKAGGTNATHSSSNSIPLRQSPICPSSMPNGTVEFWAEEMRKMNTPARAGAKVIRS